MKTYEIRKGKGRNNKNRGDVGGTGVRWFVYDTETSLPLAGFGKTACADGGFRTKKDAEAFTALLTGQVTA